MTATPDQVRDAHRAACEDLKTFARVLADIVAAAERGYGKPEHGGEVLVGVQPDPGGRSFTIQLIGNWPEGTTAREARDRYSLSFQTSQIEIDSMESGLPWILGKVERMAAHLRTAEGNGDAART